MSEGLEFAASALGLLYLLLAIYQKRSCWLAGGVASSMFMFIFWEAGLPMQALLQVFYVVMAVLGWRHWGKDRVDISTTVGQVTLRYHAGVLLGLAALTITTLLLRSALTDVQAIADTATSWAGVLATWMVARKKLEAWVYWIIIDAFTAWLYLDAALLASSALYAVYTGLAIFGWMQWRKTMTASSSVIGSE